MKFLRMQFKPVLRVIGVDTNRKETSQKMYSTDLKLAIQYAGGVSNGQT